MATAEHGHESDTEAFTALKALARSTAHDAKNSVGLIWLHLASLERTHADAPNPDVKEAIDGLKEETRQIVRLLEGLSDQAKR